ncbi:hypothetical protein [Bacillus phage MrBubbles]|nr:hypothetical protein [Bacillus phage MrBubbles]
MTHTLTKQEAQEKLQERIEANLAEGGDYGFGKVAAFRKSKEIVSALKVNNTVVAGPTKAFVEEIASLAFNGKVDEEQLQDIIDEEFAKYEVQ